MSVKNGANLSTPMDVQAPKSFLFQGAWPTDQGPLDPAGGSAYRPPFRGSACCPPNILDLTNHSLFANPIAYTTSSAGADKLARRVKRSVKVTKHGTIRYVRYGFLLVFYSNFVPKTTNIRIFHFKNVVTLKSRPNPLSVIESGTIRKIEYGFLLVLYRNYILNTPFSIYLTSKMPWPWKPGGVPSRSLEMSPQDRAHMTSCWLSIVTMALPRVVSEIFNVVKCRDLEIEVKCHSRSSEPTRIDPPPMTSY